MSPRPKRFLGTSTHSVDKKNRVFVAKRFQTCLDQDDEGHRTAILCSGAGGCLWLFSDAGFERALERFETDAFVSDEDLERQRDFFEFAHELSLDTSNRMLIPQDLRELADIREEGEVVMVGMVHRIEIWSKQRWEARPRGKTSPLLRAAGKGSNGSKSTSSGSGPNEGIGD